MANVKAAQASSAQSNRSAYHTLQGVRPKQAGRHNNKGAHTGPRPGMGPVQA
jgi:hypothetical protein